MLKGICIVSAAAMCMSPASVFAAWSISGGTDNIVTMASYKSSIVEDYQVPEHVDPSEEVKKVVNIANKGSVDIIVRAKVEKMFGTEYEDGSFTKDESLDPEMIEITYNSTMWTQRDDGYFYYNEILKAGETTKEPLFTSYRLSEKTGNAYKGKDARVVVLMDSVQAEGNAVSAWGYSYSDLGITEPAAPEGQDTSVTYNGREKGFDIELSKTDLFANFKNLLPGCSRSQNISVKNASSGKAEILLRAEAAEQEKMSEEKLELVNELLDKYATVTIKNGDETIYTGPVSGNLSGSGSTMRSDISLGEFESGAAKQLSVQLSLDPDMDNKYMELTGKVHWVFTATGEDPKGIVPVRTGDPMVPIAVFGAGVFAIAVAGFTVSRKMLKEEE